MELASGTLLQAGKYKIIGKLGQGGFGIAYRAHHQALKRDVCIKEFFYSDLCERAQNSLDVTIISKAVEKLSLVDSFKKKFTKEAQRLAKFQHPNIVQVLDTFEENSTAYFVMEYLQGGSLEDLLSREGALSEQKTKELILPLMDALDTIHKTDLLHLDIKPANIMLRNNQTPVLIDFGISKYMELVSGDTTTAPVGMSRGYTPLEQYGGSISDFSKATDVYSLCATLYKMVTGITPPEPLQIESNGLRSPRDIRSQLTTDFDAAIVKGLATKKSDRHQTMKQLLMALGESKKAPLAITPTVVEIDKPALTTAEAYFKRAEIKRNNKQFKEAITDYTEAIKRNSKTSNYFFYRALCYHDLSKLESAIEDYSKAIELDTKENAAFYNRGLCYSELNYFKAAQEDFYKAYSISKQDIYFKNWINTVKRTSDIKALNKFLSIHSDNTINSNNKKSLYFLRGELYLNAKERNKALEDFAIAKQIEGYFGWQEEALLRSLSWKSTEILKRFIVLIASNVIVLCTSFYMFFNDIGLGEPSTWNTPIPFLLILSFFTSFYLSWTPGDEWATLHRHTSANFQLIEKMVFSIIHVYTSFIITFIAYWDWFSYLKAEDSYLKIVGVIFTCVFLFIPVKGLYHIWKNKSN